MLKNVITLCKNEFLYFFTIKFTNKLKSKTDFTNRPISIIVPIFAKILEKNN